MSNHKPQPRRAMKVMWGPIRDEERAGLESNPTVEEMDFAGSFNDELAATLLDNQSHLPTSVRNFQDWHVCLMHRFMRNDTM